MADVGFDGNQIRAVFGREEGGRPARLADLGFDPDESHIHAFHAAGSVADALGERLRDVHEVPGLFARAEDLAHHRE